MRQAVRVHKCLKKLCVWNGKKEVENEWKQKVEKMCLDYSLHSVVLLVGTGCLFPVYNLP